MDPLHQAANRRGVVVFDDAVRLGVTKSRWYAAHHAGLLRRVHPCVSVLATATKSHAQTIDAAVRGLGPGALASHRSAIYLWTYLFQSDSPIPSSVSAQPHEDLVDVIVPRNRRPDSRPGLHIHRPRDQFELSPSHVDGIPCTSPLRAIVDLGAVDADAVEPAFELLMVRRLISFGAVDAALKRHCGHGRDGVRPLRRTLDRWPLADIAADSLLEIKLGRLMAEAQLGDFTFHPTIEGFEVDFAFPVQRLIIETDGWEHHGSRDAFEIDRHRDTTLAAAGWQVIRLTWRQVTDEPDRSIQHIRRARAART